MTIKNKTLQCAWLTVTCHISANWWLNELCILHSAVYLILVWRIMWVLHKLQVVRVHVLHIWLCVYMYDMVKGHQSMPFKSCNYAHALSRCSYICSYILLHILRYVAKYITIIVLMYFSHTQFIIDTGLYSKPMSCKYQYRKA